MNQKKAKELRRLVRLGLQADPLRSQHGKAVYRKLKKKYREVMHNGAW